MELPSEPYKASLGPAKKKGVEKIEWTSKPSANQGRQRACDVVRGTPGLRTNAAKTVEAIRDAFQLFMPNNMIQLIVQSTNRNIEEVLDDLPEEAVNDSTLARQLSWDICSHWPDILQRTPRFEQP